MSKQPNPTLIGGFALGGIAVEPSAHTAAGDPHRGGDVCLLPARPGPFDDQLPATDGQTSVRVGHENLLVVKTSDISTKPGGSLCQVPRCGTNLMAGYI